MLNYSGFVKNFFDQATIGGDTIIPLSLRLSRIEFSLVWTGLCNVIMALSLSLCFLLFVWQVNMPKRQQERLAFCFSLFSPSVIHTVLQYLLFLIWFILHCPSMVFFFLNITVSKACYCSLNFGNICLFSYFSSRVKGLLYRVPECLSCRLDLVLQPLAPQASVAPPGPKWGEPHSLATGQTLWYSI